MAGAAYEYLIQYITDLKGITQAKGELRKLDAYNRKFGKNVGKVTKVLSKNITQSTKIIAGGATQTTRNVERVFKTASGQMYTYTRAVTTSGGKVLRSTNKLKRGFASLGKGMQTLNQRFTGIMKRAALTIPVWLILRTVVMGVIRTISESVRAFTDLDDQLARIRTVMHGTAETIDAEMAAIKRQIIDTSLKSRIAIKDLAEGFYFLKTANLSAVEAMAAFGPTVNLAIGTMNNMAQSARAVAGIYNTMGQYLGDNLTVHEKFQHIADVLAYTYSTQDVQLSELIQSYTKMAPYVTGLTDTFLELTTMLGFLNTRLLRGGRTGRLTGRAILQLTKNSEKLAHTFGITFDPDKPIALLDTIKEIRDAMGKTGKITAEQGQIIQEVFATRGGVAIRLLIEHFDDLSDQIKDAVANADGFAQKMKELRMDTIAGQMARMKNVMAVLMGDFLSTAYGAKNLADAVKILNESLLELRPLAQGIGGLFKDAGEGFRIAYYWIRAYRQAIEETPPATAHTLDKSGATERIQKRTKELFAEMYAMDRKQTDEIEKQRDEYTKNQETIKKYNEELLELGKKRFNLLKEGREEEAKAIEASMDLIEEKITKLQPVEIQLQKLQNKEREINNLLEKKGIGYLDEIEEKDKSRLKIMKLLGASSLDIARAELEILESSVLQIDRRKEELELMKARLKINEEEIRYRQQITNVYQKAEIDLLRTAGATEQQILGVRKKQLDINRQLIGNTRYMIELEKLKVQQAKILQQEKRRELDTARNIALAYGKADEFERTRVRRIAELTQMSADDLASRYRVDAFDKGVIDDYIGYLSQEQKQAVAEMAHAMYRLPGDIRDLELDLLPESEIYSYWKTWTDLGRIAADTINARFREGISTIMNITHTITKPTMPVPMITPTPSSGRGSYNREVEGKVFGADTLEKLEKLIDAFREEQQKTREELEKINASQQETTRVNKEAF